MRTFEVTTTVSYQPGLSKLHGSLRNCLTAGVYSRGLTTVAAALGESPSGLSEKLSGGSGRKRDMGVELFEKYLLKSGDLTPIYYLIDRFIEDPAVGKQHVFSALARLCEELPALLDAVKANVQGGE